MAVLDARKAAREAAAAAASETAMETDSKPEEKPVEGDDKDVDLQDEKDDTGLGEPASPGSDKAAAAADDVPPAGEAAPVEA